MTALYTLVHKDPLDDEGGYHIYVRIPAPPPPVVPLPHRPKGARFHIRASRSLDFSFLGGMGFADLQSSGDGFRARVIRRGRPGWCYYTLRRAGENHPQAHTVIAASATGAHHKLTNSQIQKHETKVFPRDFIVFVSRSWSIPLKNRLSVPSRVET